MGGRNRSANAVETRDVDFLRNFELDRLSHSKANTSLDHVQALGFIHASHPTFSSSNVTDLQQTRLLDTYSTIDNRASIYICGAEIFPPASPVKI